MQCLPTVPKGSGGTFRITWYKSESSGETEYIANASITGVIRSIGGDIRPVDGRLYPISDSEFDWDRSAADMVERGIFAVEFSAEFPGIDMPIKTIKVRWQIV